MNDIEKMYYLSVKSHRAKINKLIKENRACYNSLNDKESAYAYCVDELYTLHKKVADIYNNSRNQLFQIEKEIEIKT